MKTAKWLVIGMVAAVAAGGVVVLKARAADTPVLRAGAGGPLARAIRNLGLSKDQITRVRAELRPDREQIVTLLGALHDARVGLREAIQKPGAAEADVRAASAKVGAAESDLAVERAKLYGRISPILTAEQLAKLGEFQQRVDNVVDGAIAVIGKRLAQ